MLIAAALVVGALELFLGSTDERRLHGADVESLTVESRAVGRDLPVEVVVPDDVDPGERRPLLVFLHGRNGDEESNLGGEMFDALADQGERAPVIAFPDGGGDSYWHDRDGGAWGRYVAREVVAAVAARFPADPRRVAIGGISMGGFGALDLARANPGRFCAVGAHSPALWRESAETAPGAFDDEADFEAHDVVEAAEAAPDPYLSLPVWVDIGTLDPFRPGTDAFITALSDAGATLIPHVWPGGHEGAYWSDHWDEYMRFYANALARCER